MKLKRYRVENFRSVKNSGWIECDDVTTLIGINEAGKSNLLLALWKLKPAREGNIDILHDMPVSQLSSFRKKPEEVKFITAEFELGTDSIAAIESAARCTLQGANAVTVTRYYDGTYKFEFLNGEAQPLDIRPIQTVVDGSECAPEDNTQFELNVNDLERAILSQIPSFVYYSNYGNLSSKIYLPNVIKWLNGESVEGIEMNSEQVRTLRVLFEFVDLNPEEILELGKDPKEVANNRTGRRDQTPSIEEIKKAEDDKEERSILLQSASGKLTKNFKDWWKQGRYKFRFEADGDYFRIWVSDEIRADEVALELRSTGLQWFISFYLIFLVESQNQHQGAVLLLDEAGLTLHPLAQKDLAAFFENLSNANQIINTTHSPFIIDTTSIERCRVVYADQNGFTVASSNLRQGNDGLNEKSIYAVHAALGLSVSEVLLQGCQVVVVEGPADQYYLNAIKDFLIREQLIAPAQEIVFVPSGGVRGVPGVVSMIAGKNNELPYVIIDSDKQGRDGQRKLLSGLYQHLKNKIIDMADVTEVPESEVEDLIPFSLMSKPVNKLFASIDIDEFSYSEEKSILPQIEQFAKIHEVDLDNGFKVSLATSVKAQLRNKKKDDIPDRHLKNWIKLFAAVESK